VYRGCCRKKAKNLMAATALVDPSRTVLIRWSNSCATIIAPSARDLRGAQSEQAMDGRGLIGHKTALKHV
jgi:hypothetical protein